MGLVIQAKNLVSRAARTQITGSSGLRRLDLRGGLTKQINQNGIVRFLFNAAGKLVGFASKVIRFFNWSISGIWDWIVERSMELVQFDWNASDQELQAQLQSSNEQLARLWGGVAGSSIGWLAAMGLGFGVSMVVPVVGGAALAGAVSLAVGKEAIQDLGGRLKSAILQSFNIAATNVTVNTYIGFRKMLKDPKNPILNWAFGDERAAQIKKNWGREGAPSWTIAGFFEKKLESIPNKMLRAFIEGAVDEGVESFIEGGYIVAYELENAYEAARLANQNQLGPEKAIVLQPDQRIDEPIILEGPQKLIQPAIQSALVEARLLHNRDVGQIVGQVAEEVITPMPQTRQLVIVFKAKQQPPWKDGKGKRVKEISYSIPDVKRGLTWEKIKYAARHFTWGEIRATANLENRRQMAVYGSTKAEAKEKLKALLELTTTKALTIRCSDDEEVPLNLKKPPTMVYPAYATLIIKRPSKTGRGVSTLEGKTYETQKIRFDLWPDQEPEDLPRLG